MGTPCAWAPFHPRGSTLSVRAGQSERLSAETGPVATVWCRGLRGFRQRSVLRTSAVPLHGVRVSSARRSIPPRHSDGRLVDSRPDCGAGDRHPVAAVEAARAHNGHRRARQHVVQRLSRTHCLQPRRRCAGLLWYRTGYARPGPLRAAKVVAATSFATFSMLFRRALVGRFPVRKPARPSRESSERLVSAEPKPSASPLALFMPTLAGGGAERVMLTLAKGFFQRGYRVDVIVVRAE